MLEILVLAAVAVAVWWWWKPIKAWLKANLTSE